MAASVPEGTRQVESAQISGKVFRFLSTMHPSLGKPERRRYAEFDPDKWYPWTPEMAAEFTDLMRRSPRDTSFARGLAYAAKKGLPEDSRLTPTELVAGLATLPAAYQGPEGSGFAVRMDRPGFAEVDYRGLPGFTNVCIAVIGELTQRLQDVGARGLDVKHGEGCRLRGAEACRFELRWSVEAGETVPASAMPAPAAPAPQPAAAANSDAPEAPAASRRAVSPRPTLAPQSAAAPAAPSAAPPGTADDLFDQLRSRLADAQRQAERHTELEAHIAALDARASELESALAAAEAEAKAATEALATLKQRLRELVG